MKLAQFVITFMQIVIKGCMESPAIKSALIILASIAAIIFIPYWVGLLAMTYVPGPAWSAGMMVIIGVALVVGATVMVYVAVYDAIKKSMG